MTPLFKAWDRAKSASPWSPTPRDRDTDPDPDPQSGRDAAAADRLLGKGDYMAALALASRSLQHRHVYPAQWTADDLTANRTRGIALYHLGAYREAADALVDYTIEVPNDPNGHYYLAAALHRSGRRDDALVHLSAAAQIAPADPLSNPAQASYERLAASQDPGFPQPWILEKVEAEAGTAP